MKYLLSIFTIVSAWKCCLSGTVGRFNAHANSCAYVASGQRGPNIVRTVSLSCKQGSFLWNNPIGAVFITFSSLAGEQQDAANTNRPYKICIRFDRQQSPLISVYKAVNHKFDSFSNKIDVSDYLIQPYCSTVSGDKPFSLYMRAADGSAVTGGGAFAGFEYIVDGTTVLSTTPQSGPRLCGECTEEMFRQAYCSSDFVFQGRLLKHLPEYGVMDYSLTSVVRHTISLEQLSRIGFVASLLTNCPKPIIGTLFNTEFVVVGNLRFDVAHLVCAMPALDYNRLVESAEWRSAEPC